MLDTNKKNQRFLEAYKNIEFTQNIKLDSENYITVYIFNKEFLSGISYINCGKNSNFDIMSISRTREGKSIKEIILILEIF